VRTEYDSCTVASHEALKIDRATFDGATTYIGEQHFPWGEVHRLANCHRCRTTLAYLTVAGRLPYEAPAVVSDEAFETLSMACGKNNPHFCPSGSKHS
jgi:hypothetical protein